MVFQYFSNSQIYALLVSGMGMMGAIVLFEGERRKLGVVVLFLGALGLGYFMGSLDGFLMLWDEQYHALVAKNMMSNPFKPMLYGKPLLDYNFRSWTDNHVWLHKQPLFLWQMALSLKLFGINEVAVRIPSMVAHALTGVFVYRIGKIACNDRVGFYGALFFCVAYYPLELVAGRYATDHNDVSFLFYVAGSFWSWFEYEQSKRVYWLVLIGVFAGCGVLVKWLVGLLIYAVWAVTLGVDERKIWLKWKAYLPIVVSLGIAVAVFLPWQLYVFYKFPVEASYEFRLNAAHFYQVTEQQGGGFWFHWNALKDIYGSGDLVPFLLILGLFLFVRKCSSQLYRVAILAAIIITYGFFTIAATKMIAFCLIVSPFFFLGLGALAETVVEWIKRKIKIKTLVKAIVTILLLGVCFFLIDITKVANYHTEWKPLDNCNRAAELKEMALIETLKAVLQDENYVVFNACVRKNGHIPIMFYTHYVAYNFVPDQAQINRIKQQSYKIAIVDVGSLPDFIRNDAEIIKIKAP